MNKLLLLTALALGVGGGYLLAQLSLGEPEPEKSSARSYRAAPAAQPSAETRSVATGSVSSQAASTPAAALSPSLKQLGSQSDLFATMHKAYQLAADAAPEQLAALARESFEHPDPFFAYNVAGVFLERLVTTDLDAALILARDLPAGELRKHHLASVLGSWARLDEEAVFGYFAGIDDTEVKRRVAASLLRDTVLSEAFRLAVKGELGAYGEQLARTIAQLDQQPSEAFFSALDQAGPERSRALYTSGMRWFRHAPEDALSAVANLPASRERQQLLQSMLGELAARDPQQALTLMEVHAPNNEAVEQVILARYAKADPVSSRARVEAYVERTGSRQVLAQWLSGWVEQDAAAATAYAAALPQHQQQQVIHNMASTYLKSDPRSAIEWLLSLEGGRVDGLAMVQSQFTPETVQIAQSMLNEVSEPAQREQLVRALAMHKVRDNPAQALEWLAQYPDHSKYADIHANALHHWASSDPAGATSALEQRWYEPQMTESFRTVAWSLGQRNPQEAVDWARSLPESPGRDAAFSSLVQMVAQRNPEQARSLYESLPTGKDRDRAGAALANQLAGGDPERMRETMAELGMSRDAIEAYLLIWTR